MLMESVQTIVLKFNSIFSMNIESFRKFEHNTIDLCDERENFYVSIENCQLHGRDANYPNCLLYSQNSLISPYDEKIMSLNKETFYEDNRYTRPEESGESFIEDPVYFFVYNCGNYYHFIYDTLPYLINYKLLGSPKILINYPSGKSDFYKFNKDLFHFLGIENIIIAKKGMRFRKLIVSPSLTHGGLSNKPPHPSVYTFFRNMKTFAKKSPKRIYISRRTWTRSDNDNIGTNYTQRRKMVNEDKIVRLLVTEYGYTEIFAEDYSIEEKINLFQQAECIVGAIGGGMCNLLFSRPTTNTLCIVSPYFIDINERFKFSMEHTNITYFDKCSIEKNGEIPLFVRVRITDKNSSYHNRIGEVCGEYNNNYTVNLSDEGTTGFASNVNFEKHTFDPTQLSLMDNGLNSPYKVDLQEFKNTLLKFHQM